MEKEKPKQQKKIVKKKKEIVIEHANEFNAEKSAWLFYLAVKDQLR